MTLELHFWAVKSSGLSLRFRSINDYLRGLFLHVRVSDYWWCPGIVRLLYGYVSQAKWATEHAAALGPTDQNKEGRGGHLAEQMKCSPYMHAQW